MGKCSVLLVYYSKGHGKFLFPVPAEVVYGSFYRAEGEISTVGDDTIFVHRGLPWRVVSRRRGNMIHKIEYKDRSNVISCYLPEGSVPDKNAAEELHQMTAMEQTLEKLAAVPGFFQGDSQRVEKIILTPDFHKGAGIPIGTVMMTKGFAVPQAMGNDINCGMRFYTTDLSEEKLLEKLSELTGKIRHIFFEGGRQIPMTGRQRQALLRHGLEGLLETGSDGKKSGL